MLRLDAKAAMEGDAAAHPESLRPGFVRPAGAPPPPPVPMPAGHAYFEYQVEKPVTPAPGSLGPRFPEALKAANVEGEVLAQFVVDENGRVEIGTFKVLRSDHALFTAAVRDALVGARYVPADVGGKAVRQVVQQPFQFRLTK